MAAATDHLRILDELGIDTEQLRSTGGHSSRILKGKDGQRYPGLYFNRQAGTSYFTVNSGVAAVEIDWNLWQNAPPSISVPYFDRDKHNVVPRPGQERRHCRVCWGCPRVGD